jgi:predicted house-cleaning noncanonical NTP pyrophosphatase (MazG superfamily)
MKEYHKLVRDKIPEIISEAGSIPSTHVANDDEYRAKLYEKLVEESKEVIQSPSIDEIADVWEVMLAICKLEGWSLDEVEKVRVAKADERGAFNQRIILDSVS